MMVPNRHLKQARELRGWSQAKVAREIGTDATTVSRWERGLFSPTPYFRERLCMLFEQNTAELGLLEPTQHLVHLDISKRPASEETFATSPQEVHTGPLRQEVHTGPLISEAQTGTGLLHREAQNEPLADLVPPCWSESTDTFEYILHSAAHDQQAHMLWKDAYVRSLRGQRAEARLLGEASLKAFEEIGHVNAVAVREWLNQQAFLSEEATPIARQEPALAHATVATTPANLAVVESGNNSMEMASVSAAPANLPSTLEEDLRPTLKRFLRAQGSRIALIIIGSFWMLFSIGLPSVR